MAYLLSQLYQNVLYGSACIILLSVLKRPLLRRGAHFCFFYLWLIAIFALFNPISFCIIVPDKLGELFISEHFFKSVLPLTTNITFLALCVWLFGCTVSFLALLSTTRKIKKLQEHSCKSPSSTMLAMLAKCKEELSINKPVSLCILKHVATPIIYESKSSIIMLPDKAYTEDELRYIFMHELLHLKHHDIQIKRLGYFAQIFYWWNPFVYLLINQMEEACEYTCDYRALRRMPVTERCEYAQVILNFARDIIAKPKYRHAALSGNTFKRRFTFMLKPQQPVKKTAIIIFAITLAIGSFFTLRAPLSLPDTASTPLTEFTVVQRFDGLYDIYDNDGNIIHVGVDNKILDKNRKTK